MRARIPLPAIGLALAACSGDPASQQPVELKPGNYEVTVNAEGMIDVALYGEAAKAPRTVCIQSHQAKDWHETMVSRYVKPTTYSGCFGKGQQRSGNAFTGQVVCPSPIGGKLQLAYAGRIAEAEIAIDAEQTFVETADEDAALKESLSSEGSQELNRPLKLQYKARRIGDCG